ncbi:MAG: aminotransferase class V-fold PLP-dependent enzyme, partial [Gemmatimonadales bacterium]|nr:aminotransferase class V-fold PLP-dependent enzyme [Gemmatimonadales bacterium]
MTTSAPLRSPVSPLAAHDVAAVRRNFPILTSRVGNHPLVYLDNAATSQKPKVVIDAVRAFYEGGNANVHRGIYQLSESATAAYESARIRVAEFLGAAHPHEIIFTRGTTEAINLVAQSYARPRLQPGDEILITAMEHHSNIVPWQLVCGQTGAVLRVAPVSDSGELNVAEFESLIGDRTRLVAVTHVSNALGTINPVKGLV